MKIQPILVLILWLTVSLQSCSSTHSNNVEEQIRDCEPLCPIDIRVGTTSAQDTINLLQKDPNVSAIEVTDMSTFSDRLPSGISWKGKNYYGDARFIGSQDNPIYVVNAFLDRPIRITEANEIYGNPSHIYVRLDYDLLVNGNPSVFISVIYMTPGLSINDMNVQRTSGNINMQDLMSKNVSWFQPNRDGFVRAIMTSPDPSLVLVPWSEDMTIQEYCLKSYQNSDLIVDCPP